MTACLSLSPEGQQNVQRCSWFVLFLWLFASWRNGNSLYLILCLEMLRLRSDIFYIFFFICYLFPEICQAWVLLTAEATGRVCLLTRPVRMESGRDVRRNMLQNAFHPHNRDGKKSSLLHKLLAQPRLYPSHLLTSSFTTEKAGHSLPSADQAESQAILNSLLAYGPWTPERTFVKELSSFFSSDFSTSILSKQGIKRANLM